MDNKQQEEPFIGGDNSDLMVASLMNYIDNTTKQTDMMMRLITNLHQKVSFLEEQLSGKINNTQESLPLVQVMDPNTQQSNDIDVADLLASLSSIGGGK